MPSASKKDSFDKSVTQVITSELEQAFSDTVIENLARRVVSPTVIRRINERVERADFLGGDLANKGYSEALIPAYFLGNLQKNGGFWQLQNTELNITVDPAENLIWRGGGDGGVRAYLEGGYKKFRELAGRRTDRVRLQFTGTMMRGLDSRIELVSGRVTVKTGVYNERSAVSGYLNARREFLALSDPELDQLDRSISDYLYKLI